MADLKPGYQSTPLAVIKKLGRGKAFDLGVVRHDGLYEELGSIYLITREPDLRATQSGLSVISFTLAVERNYKNKATGKYDADFINCVAWNKTAETVGKRCHKGDLISASGEIQTRSYEKDSGEKVYVTEVNVRQIGFLRSKYNQPQEQAKPQTRANETAQEAITQANKKDPFAGTGNTVEVKEDQLPF